MLFIGKKTVWHVGGDKEPQAALDRVVTFQADGHELDMILMAMRLAYVGADGQVHFNEED